MLAQLNSSNKGLLSGSAPASQNTSGGLSQLNQSNVQILNPTSKVSAQPQNNQNFVSQVQSKAQPIIKQATNLIDQLLKTDKKKLAVDVGKAVISPITRFGEGIGTAVGAVATQGQRDQTQAASNKNFQEMLQQAHNATIRGDKKTAQKWLDLAKQTNEQELKQTQDYIKQLDVAKENTVKGAVGTAAFFIPGGGSAAARIASGVAAGGAFGFGTSEKGQEVQSTATGAALGGGLALATEALMPLIQKGLTRLTAKEAQQVVIHSDLENTQLGKAIIKASVQAESTGKRVELTKIAEGIDTKGMTVAETPGGQRIGVKVVEPTPPSTIGESRGVAGSREVAPLDTKGLDKTTAQKIQDLNTKDAQQPVKDGMERVYQAVAPGGKTDYVFKTPEELAQFKNNVTSPEEKFQFLDVPSKDIKPVEGKQGVFQVTNTEKVPQKPIGTGETKTPQLSLGVEAKAVENKLTKSLGDLPEYKTVNMKEQAQKATDLLAKDSELAKSIALGEKTPPSDILPEAVFTAVENKALQDGNISLIRDLAKSNLTTEATAMGQRIRTLAERDPESVVANVRDVAKARLDAIEKRTGKKLGDAIKSEVDNIKKQVKVPKKDEWAQFIQSIQC